MFTNLSCGGQRRAINAWLHPVGSHVTHSVIIPTSVFRPPWCKSPASRRNVLLDSIASSVSDLVSLVVFLLKLLLYRARPGWSGRIDYILPTIKFSACKSEYILLHDTQLFQDQCLSNHFHILQAYQLVSVCASVSNILRRVTYSRCACVCVCVCVCVGLLVMTVCVQVNYVDKLDYKIFMLEQLFLIYTSNKKH